ncbi:MAG: cyanophycin synthetase [Myxococcota bacterium]
MDILHLRATVGPNLYSVEYHRLVVARVRLADGDAPAAVEALGKDALALQREATGFAGGFLLVQSLREPDVRNLVFEALDEGVGFASVRGALAATQPGTPRRDVLDPIRAEWKAHRLLLSTQALVDEAKRRGIPSLVLNDRSLVQLGYGCNQQRIQDTLTENTSIIGVDLVGDKRACKEFLASMDIPVPAGREIASPRELEAAVEAVGYPLVIKPTDGHQGKGVFSDVRNFASASRAYGAASKHGSRVLVEEHVSGRDYRVLVVDGHVEAAALREPASVLGDGESTIEALVERENQNPLRGYDHEKALTRLQLDEVALRLLERADLGPESVPGEGVRVALRSTANLSTGGTAKDVTDEIHPENVRLFERVAQLVGLDVAGLDIVATDLRSPIGSSGGKIIEVNAAPGFRMHLSPSAGQPRDVCSPVIRRLFPPGTPSRIPIFAITGTNGKTTTTRLLAHLLQTAGARIGFTSSDGVYIGGHLVQQGDRTDEHATRLVLQDPWVDTAVFEYPRGGIIRAGLGFDACSVGIVMNVSADHLGSRDVHTVAELAQVKAVVARSVRPDGFAVLNADDDHCYAMSTESPGRSAFFSCNDENPRLAEADLTAFLKDGMVVLQRGPWPHPIARASDIPLTLGGQAFFNIENVLAAALAAFCHGLPPTVIRRGLLTFEPGVALTPGRMNYFYGDSFRVLVDYAHNAESMSSLGRYLAAAESGVPRIGVLGGTGDRLDEDITGIGRVAADMFDRIIIREDRDLRGRPPGQTADLVLRGVHSQRPGLPCEVVLDSDESVLRAMESAQQGELICILGGDVSRTLALVRSRCRPTP